MSKSENDENGDSKKRNGRKMTRHHVVPRSRGGGEIEKNIVKISDRYHVAWHTFFGNLTPREAIHLIRKLFLKRKDGNTKWKPRDIYFLQLEIQAETLRKEKAREEG
jgi:hypothetical protein